MPPSSPPCWLDQLAIQLRQLDADCLRRGLRAVNTLDGGRLVAVDGRSLLNLAGNDYLALAAHPRIVDAVINAARSHGFGSGASRLVTGHRPMHEQVEQRFARFKHAQAALLCPTGYMANLAALTTLADSRDDVVLLDKLNHASLIDAARASPATVRVYPHRNLDRLQRLLTRCADARRRVIVTDAVFSMDGDAADLPALCELAARCDAILMVDEAHGTGVLGPSGAGLAEAQGVADRVDVAVSTASKALGGLGGIITAHRVVIDAVVNKARSFIYTTAVPVVQAAALDAALDILEAEPHRRHRLAELSSRLRGALRRQGWPLPSPARADETDITPIFPLIVGSAEAALALADHLRRHGIHAPAIRPPTVAPGSARVRVTLRADLRDDDLDRLIDALDLWPRSR